MARCAPRPSPLLASSVLVAVSLLGVACAERDAPPPVDAAPAVPPVVTESIPDTLVGDSVMARDTIPLPPP